MDARDHETAHTPVCGSQRKGTDRLKPGSAHNFDRCRKAGLAIQSPKHECFLIAENPGGYGLFAVAFSRTAIAWTAIPAKVPIDFVGLLVKLRDAVELYNPAQFVGQDIK